MVSFLHLPGVVNRFAGQGGIIMAGSGVQIGENVLILYNDSPDPLTVASLGIGSTSAAPSQWIVPGYYYPPSQFILCILCVYILYLIERAMRRYCIRYSRMWHDSVLFPVIGPSVLSTANQNA